MMAEPAAFFVVWVMPSTTMGEKLELTFGEELPDWAATSLAVMAANGVELEAEAPMTRGQAAQTLYQISRMAATAPGMMVFNMQQ